MTDLRIAKDRLLYMYSRLVDGKMLYKKEEAQRFGCSLRSIQRDIEDLRSFLHEQNEASGLVQDFGGGLGSNFLEKSLAFPCVALDVVGYHCCEAWGCAFLPPEPFS